MNAESLVEHLEKDLSARTPFFPLLPEAILNPQEVWQSFELHKGTGKVVLRQRIIKVVRTDKDRALVVVVQAVNGMLEAWTLFPRSKLGSLKNERQGALVWNR